MRTKKTKAVDYFEWLYKSVYTDKHDRPYRKLFSRLHETEFIFSIALDKNRASDGIALRRQFGLDDERPCSVLEMMIALNNRCELMVTGSLDDNHDGLYFWTMILNLDLIHMYDYNFDCDYMDDVISTMLNREYAPDGDGGLFTVEGRGDLRKVEIWYQMCWYLNENMIGAKGE
ncbi:hypothetical protein AGMMS49975_12470 [Clostridia bacterium]|nr:hypothetical protein AGMMS49975_12470 [Clostridia bacterium]